MLVIAETMVSSTQREKVKDDFENFSQSLLIHDRLEIVYEKILYIKTITDVERGRRETQSVLKNLKKILTPANINFGKEELLRQITQIEQEVSVQSELNLSFLAEKQQLLDELLSSFNSSLQKTLMSQEDKIAEEFKFLEYLEIILLSLIFLALYLESVFIFSPAIKSLEAETKARNDFFSKVSHEIKNPMNAILGMLSLVEAHELNNVQKDYLKRAKTSARSLLSFLTNVILYSERGHAWKKNAKAMNSISELTYEISSLMSSSAYDKGLPFYLYIHPDTPASIEVDVIYLRHVLINLIGNSLKFTERGFIEFGVMPTKSGIKFWIRDTGKGIPKDKVEIIFDEFEQSDSSVKRKYGGAGLGLSIAKDYAHIIGASISVESEVDKGSTFWVELSVKKSEAKASKDFSFNDIPLAVVGDPKLSDWARFHGFKVSSLEEASKVISDDIRPLSLQPGQNVLLFTTADLSGEDLQERERIFPLDPFFKEEKGEGRVNLQLRGRVAVVDDSEDNRIILSEYLNQSFDWVDVFSHGEDYLKSYQEKEYDLTFLDIQMPGMDGFSVIEKLPRNRKGMIVAFTAHSSDLEAKKMRAAGFNHILTKPLDPKSLNAILKDFSLDALEVKAKEVEADDFEKRILAKLQQKKGFFLNEQYSALEKAETLLDMKRCGHNLKGSSKNYGFVEIGQLGAQLEEACANQKEESALNLKNEILKRLRSAKDGEYEKK